METIFFFMFLTKLSDTFMKWKSLSYGAEGFCLSNLEMEKKLFFVCLFMWFELLSREKNSGSSVYTLFLLRNEFWQPFSEKRKAKKKNCLIVYTNFLVDHLAVLNTLILSHLLTHSIRVWCLFEPHHNLLWVSE